MKKKPAMFLEPGEIDLEKAVKHPRNPKRHDLETIRSSMGSHGFLERVLINRTTGRILAGHGRLETLRSMKEAGTEAPVGVRVTGKRWEVPCDYVSIPEENEQEILAILNQTTIAGGWDEPMLAEILQRLEKRPQGLAGMGFDRDYVSKLFDRHGMTAWEVADELVPLPADNPISRPGDLITMGRHRLMCGDSSVAEDVERLLGGAKIHLVNTDPPYNVKVEPRTYNAIAAAGKKKKQTQRFDERNLGVRTPTHKKLRARDRALENDFTSGAQFTEMIAKVIKLASDALLPGHHFYFWGGYANCWGQHDAPNIPPIMASVDLFICQMIIWQKMHPVLVRKPFLQDYEICFFGWKTGAKHRRLSVMNASDIWTVKKINPAAMIHLTEKPVELAARAIKYSSKRGENVLDLFGGSGSTLMACEELDRCAFLMEKDAAYCDVIVERWEKATGKKATREKGVRHAHTVGA